MIRMGTWSDKTVCTYKKRKSTRAHSIHMQAPRVDHVRTQEEDICKLRRETSPDTNLAGTLILDLTSITGIRYNQLFKPPIQCCCATAVQADKYSVS
jgi:hypothetical protein